MSFHVSIPLYDANGKCHVLTINDGPIFTGRVAPSYEPIMDERFTGFITEFLKQASPYFSKALDQPLFLQRVCHTYSTDEDLKGATSVSWIPACILFYPSRYEIRWQLVEIERSTPGTDIIETDIQASERPVKELGPSAQKRIRQKVRQARLKCALARLHLERLTERYYAKYGNFDGMSDSDSELSSDFEPQEK
jgi:hypothetical protein